MMLLHQASLEGRADTHKALIIDDFGVKNKNPLEQLIETVLLIPLHVLHHKAVKLDPQLISL